MPVLRLLSLPVVAVVAVVAVVEMQEAQEAAAMCRLAPALYRLGQRVVVAVVVVILRLLYREGKDFLLRRVFSRVRIRASVRVRQAIGA